MDGCKFPTILNRLANGTYNESSPEALWLLKLIAWKEMAWIR